MDEPTEPNLEEAILTRLTDPEPYLVYADWLQERGVARGKLIAVQVAMAASAVWDLELEAAERALLHEHPELRVPTYPKTLVRVKWRFGFWHELRVAVRAGEPPLDITPLLEDPSSRFLRGLELENVDLGASIEPLRVRRRTIRRLERAGTLGASDASWLEPLVLDKLVVSRIEDDLLPMVVRESLMTLELEQSGPAVPRALAGHPRLMRLDLGEAEALTAAEARALVSIPLLAELRVRCRRLGDFDPDPDSVSRSFLIELARASRLRVLELDGADLDDDSCAELAKLETLEELTIKDPHHVTIFGLRPLQRLPRLKRLSILAATFDLESDPGALNRWLNDMAVPH